MAKRYAAIRLDNEKDPAGPGTIVAFVETVGEYLKLCTDRDGARDRRFRLCTVVHDELEVGSRTQLADESVYAFAG